MKLIHLRDISSDRDIEDSCCLTVDVDWAHEYVLLDTLELLLRHNASATIFMTHPVLSLDSVLKQKNFELGIHPNFNKLLSGLGNKEDNLNKIIDELLSIVPNAVSARSHSLGYSSHIQEYLRKSGILFESNIYIPYQSNNYPINPITLWNGLIRIPYFFCDLGSLLYDFSLPMDELVRRPGLKVFDFHPIHVFLNTESLDRYERTRHLHQNPDELIKYRFEGEGTRTRLLKLLSLAAEPSQNDGDAKS